jgi:hypothetical protein
VYTVFRQGLQASSERLETWPALQRWTSITSSFRHLYLKQAAPAGRHMMKKWNMGVGNQSKYDTRAQRTKKKLSVLPRYFFFTPYRVMSLEY